MASETPATQSCSHCSDPAAYGGELCVHHQGIEDGMMHL